MMLDFGSVVELPSVGAASDGGLSRQTGLFITANQPVPIHGFNSNTAEKRPACCVVYGREPCGVKVLLVVGGGEHSLEHRESSFCSSNMPTMSKQQLHKAGVSIHQSRLEVGLSSQLGWNW
ncbi:hypothetical protein fugu_007944 [Takifugu bimaculatus]|uniref:Uncharacterized protein n=1 Tax=Takifugu bimaculatus TaxID=433685 RepID=A0A4Z2AZX6_9TELE|nr:hypothetical protein fugu_007944 [Takifugu bimaculatus]